MHLFVFGVTRGGKDVKFRSTPAGEFAFSCRAVFLSPPSFLLSFAWICLLFKPCDLTIAERRRKEKRREDAENVYMYMSRLADIAKVHLYEVAEGAAN
ncbi:hypothetical protein K432DRAFT_229833 [Lepidopterella palustris CBS 459.81]|uniref:Uncharacterized protein n=1 Tax=Lepidopterella palustris CBS 459.81 TaxID=1314670 RepID=A0A8E2EDX0_9PEZI|nr:hypothetical protein K432DRAFT_229833 [Lepidopterella palustris CBS 459.81]